MEAKWIIKKSNDDQYFFILKAPNSETLLLSEMYTTKDNAYNGINAIERYITQGIQIEEQLEK